MSIKESTASISTFGNEKVMSSECKDQCNITSRKAIIDGLNDKFFAKIVRANNPYTNRHPHWVKCPGGKVGDLTLTDLPNPKDAFIEEIQDAYSKRPSASTKIKIGGLKPEIDYRTLQAHVYISTRVPLGPYGKKLGDKGLFCCDVSES
eukprot:Tbor_TRINITY_DN5973_c0_g1::TRINITY_DN5973_c0_g1_i1::g.18979::m.18979